MRFDAFRNPDGTYNGEKLFSKITRLGEDEIAWTFERLKYLIHVKKMTSNEAKAIVAEEAKSKPWMK